MPEIKNTFLAGKMNKSLDDRLLPEGEYRDALNVQVTKSEGADTGAVQNIKGNTLIGDIDLPEGYEVVGTYFDDQENAIYWFVTNDTSSYVYRYGAPPSLSPLPTGTTTTTTTSTTTTTTTTIAPTLSVVVSGQASPQESTQYTYNSAVGGTATGTVTYSWSAVNGTIIGSNTNSSVVVLWDEVASNTAGSVSVSISRGGLNANDTLNTTIIDIPASFGIEITENGSAVLTTNLPQNSIVTYGTRLSGTATGAVTYDWTVTGGTFVGEGTDSITVTWTTPGTGTIRVDAVREGVSADNQKSITITPGVATIDLYVRTPLEDLGLTVQYSVNGGAYQVATSGSVTATCAYFGTISGLIDGDSVVLRFIGSVTAVVYDVNGTIGTSCPTSISGATGTYNYGTVSIGTNNAAVIIDNTPNIYTIELGYASDSVAFPAYAACQEFVFGTKTTVYANDTDIQNITAFYTDNTGTALSENIGYYSDGVYAVAWNGTTIVDEVTCSSQTTTTTTVDQSIDLFLGYDSGTGTGFNSASAACSADIETVGVHYYHINENDVVEVGTIVYTDNSLSITFNGNFKWYQIFVGAAGVSQVVEINSTGVIITVSNCT